MDVTLPEKLQQLDRLMMLDASMPMLTDRLTFKITEQMVRTRKADGLEPTTRPAAREKEKK